MNILPSNNVVDLASIKFPVGSKAWHHKYRICHIVESSGCSRKIKSLKLDSSDMEWLYISVHVNELHILLDMPGKWF